MMSLSPSGVFEFMQAGALAQHWEEHHALKPELGFDEFMFLHYFDVEHDGDDPVDHGQLPFHQHGLALMVFVPNEGVLYAVRATRPPSPTFAQLASGERIGISVPGDRQ